jgi:hypothetical protein
METWQILLSPTTLHHATPLVEIRYLSNYGIYHILKNGNFLGFLGLGLEAKSHLQGK